LQQVFLDGVAAAPADASALDAVAAALQAAAVQFPDDRRPASRLRQAVILANPGLQERELLKLATLAAGVADALRDRGIHDPGATLAAESGVTVFGVAFRQWVAEGEERSFAAVVDATLQDWKRLSPTR